MRTQEPQPAGQPSPTGNDAASLLRWARTSESSALAVLRPGGYLLRYPLFDELDAATRGGLRWLSGGSRGDRCRGLAELALHLGQQLLESGQVRSFARFAREDGKGAVEVRLERVRRVDGDLAVVIAHPTAARPGRQADDDARREQRMQAVGMVASGVAHDLNHALNVIALRLARLRQDPSLAKVRAHIESLERVADEAAATVARLQDLVRRRRDAPTATMELAKVVDAAVEAARSETEEGGSRGDAPRVGIEAELPRLPPVRGSATEIGRVFLDLILTAADSTAKDGVVRVAVRADGDRAVATVEGGGPGVPEQHLGRMFDPFFTVSARRDTGIALSIAAGVMARLGGSVAVDNRPGGGTVYTLTFPFARPDAPAVRSPGARPPAQPLRVLLVDDEADNLEVLGEVLAADGHRVAFAQSGRAALDLLRADDAFDLVLCDVGMPGMSGWQVVREALQIRPRLCIYMLTGWAREVSADDPRARLVRGVLGKPIDLDHLRRLLAEIPAARQAPAASPG